MLEGNAPRPGRETPPSDLELVLPVNLTPNSSARNLKAAPTRTRSQAATVKHFKLPLPRPPGRPRHLRRWQASGAAGREQLPPPPPVRRPRLRVRAFNLKLKLLMLYVAIMIGGCPPARRGQGACTVAATERALA